MKLMAVAALACLTGTAMGAPVHLASNEVFSAPGEPNIAFDATGIFGARMAVFSSVGGAFYDDSTGGAGANLQNFGVVESMGAFQTRQIMISSLMNILPNGNQQIIIESFTADGLPFVAGGTTLGGALISALQFDIGTPNAPADPIDFNLSIAVVSASFTVSSSATTFGPFASTFTTPGGNSLTLRNGVNAGTDITTFGINRFTVTVELTKIVPAPGALALAGIGGLVAVRRRRR